MRFYTIAMSSHWMVMDLTLGCLRPHSLLPSGRDPCTRAASPHGAGQAGPGLLEGISQPRYALEAFPSFLLLPQEKEALLAGGLAADVARLRFLCLSCGLTPGAAGSSASYFP